MLRLGSFDYVIQSDVICQLFKVYPEHPAALFYDGDVSPFLKDLWDIWHGLEFGALKLKASLRGWFAHVTLVCWVEREVELGFYV
jgi:hypothetical protein